MQLFERLHVNTALRILTLKKFYRFEFTARTGTARIDTATHITVRVIAKRPLNN